MLFFFFFSSRRRHTSCALVTGVQTCALPIYSAYAELNAPIFDQLEVNASGRYDRYSGGLDNFSPKIGVKVKPIKEVLLRGTYSRGFRSEERRVGKECVSTCRSRWSPYH